MCTFVHGIVRPTILKGRHRMPPKIGNRRSYLPSSVGTHKHVR